jgi:hypothetical protein
VSQTDSGAASIADGFAEVSGNFGAAFWAGFPIKPKLEGVRRSRRVAGLQAGPFYARSGLFIR